MRIVLVRHAEPEIEVDVPAEAWPLTVRGIESTRRLVPALRELGPTRIVASPERKAIETAEVLAGELALPVAQDTRFAEQGAEAGQFLTDYSAFRDLVRQHFAQPDEVVMRGESARAAGARFAAGVEACVGTGLPVVVSHGRIIASWLAAVTGEPAWALWTGLRMPDLIEVDLSAPSFRSIPVPLF